MIQAELQFSGMIRDSSLAGCRIASISSPGSEAEEGTDPIAYHHKACKELQRQEGEIKFKQSNWIPLTWF